jgi:glycerol uptake facilitator-like aquaporin
LGWQYKVGGCTIDTALVKPVDAFAIEFTTDMALIFLSFGVGLDPRQRVVFGPTLGPIFVGLILGICSFGTGFIRPGYSGVCMSSFLCLLCLLWMGLLTEGCNVAANPARCFGAFAGSHFESYHWVHWAGPVLAAIFHGIMYHIVPPYFHLKPLDG